MRLTQPEPGSRGGVWWAAARFCGAEMEGVGVGGTVSLGTIFGWWHHGAHRVRLVNVGVTLVMNLIMDKCGPREQAAGADCIYSYPRPPDSPAGIS